MGSSLPAALEAAALQAAVAQVRPAVAGELAAPHYQGALAAFLAAVAAARPALAACLAVDPSGKLEQGSHTAADTAIVGPGKNIQVMCSPRALGADLAPVLGDVLEEAPPLGPLHAGPGLVDIVMASAPVAAASPALRVRHAAAAMPWLRALLAPQLPLAVAGLLLLGAVAPLLEAEPPLAAPLLAALVKVVLPLVAPLLEALVQVVLPLGAQLPEVVPHLAVLLPEAAVAQVVQLLEVAPHLAAPLPEAVVVVQTE